MSNGSQRRKRRMVPSSSLAEDPDPGNAEREPQPISRRSMRAAVAELPIGVGGTVFGVLLLARVYVVAHYSLTTTTGLVSAAPASVLLGTIASYTYLLVAVLAFVSLFLWLKAGAMALGNLWSIVLLSSFVTFSLLSPWYYWWWVGGVASVLTGIAYIREPISLSVDAQDWWRSAAIRVRLHAPVSGIWNCVRRPMALLLLDLVVVVLGTALSVSAIVATLDQPWMPGSVVVFAKPEVVAEKQTDANRTAETTDIDIAYIVSSDGNWTKLLDAERRFLFEVPTADIRARYTCRVEGEVLVGRSPIVKHKAYFSPNRDCASLESEVRAGRYPVAPK